jgi:hypothetical protein
MRKPGNFRAFLDHSRSRRAWLRKLAWPVIPARRWHYLDARRKISLGRTVRSAVELGQIHRRAGTSGADRNQTHGPWHADLSRFSGATNWYTPAYNPDTHLFYFLALEDCGTSFLKPESFAEGRPYYATGVRRSRGTKREKSLVAYNFDTGAFEWRYPQAAKASLPAA